MRLGRQLGLLLASAVVFASTGFAEVGKRYIVVLKSEQNYRMAKDISQRSAGFLGTRAKAEAYLDNLEMVIVNSESTDIGALRNNPNVAFVEEERLLPPPRFIPKRKKFASFASNNSELTWGLKAVKAPEAWSITKGAGTRVLVLDTGLDEKHPDLVNRFEKGKSFIGGSLTDEVGHGTHTSGTILADGSGSGLMGVAPEARLLMGKVCSAQGCSTTAIVQGVEWGIQEKVDVINMSLGGPFLFPTQAQAYKKAEQAGITIAAASGNGGNASVSYPAAIDTVMAVGAIDVKLAKAAFSQWGPQLDIVAPGVDVMSTVPQGMGREGFVKINGVEVLNTVFQNSNPAIGALTVGDFVNAGLGKPADVQGKSLSGKLALVQRGEITFSEKVKTVTAAGAVGVVIYNNEPGLINGGLDAAINVAVIMIEQTVGEQIAAELAQSQAVSASIGVVATDYAAFQGTSMASPHVAGVMALVKSANKALTPLQIRELLKSTATPLAGPNTQNELGKGLVNAEKAVSQARSVRPVRPVFKRAS